PNARARKQTRREPQQETSTGPLSEMEIAIRAKVSSRLQEEAISERGLLDKRSQAIASYTDVACQFIR
ncbi:hypothetical protein BGX20_006566, partial [Mortierella sp. AD010]